MQALLCAFVVAASPYNGSIVPHAAAAGAGLATVLVAELALKPMLEGGLACDQHNGHRCAAHTVNAADRVAIQRHSRAWDIASDASAITAFSGATLFTFLDSYLTGDSAEAAAMEWTIIGESTAIAAVVTEGLRFGVRRPTPAQYRFGARDVDSTLSFPSGHTSTVAAASAAYATTFWMRHPDSAWRWAVAGGALGVTGITAAGRVLAGQRFVTDVAAGAALGTLVGLAVPLVTSALKVHPVVTADVTQIQFAMAL